VAVLSERLPPQPGGLARAVARIAHGLAEQGWEVELFALSDALPPGVLQVEDEPGTSPRPRVSRLGLQKRADDAQAALFDVLVARHRVRPFDVVHGFYLVRAGFLAAYAGRYLGVRTLVSARGNDLDRALFDASAQAGILHALQSADVVTAVSQDLGRKARALAPRARVEVVPNAVDAALFRPTARASATLPELALAGREVVGFSGELRRKKGLVPLFQALAGLAERRPLTLLALGGVRADDQALFDLLRRQHPRVQVALVPYREPAELAALHALMDVCVHPSRHDGLPNALLEAMACACPIVATTAGGIPDALRDGQEGLLVEPGDVPALASALARLLDDRELARRYGRAARARVLAEFTPAAEIERYVRLYHAS
jgi:glycosyltransferase involved in cell wall biosynthesis